MVLISCVELHCVVLVLYIVVIDSALLIKITDYETERCLQVPDSALAEVFLCDSQLCVFICSICGIVLVTLSDSKSTKGGISLGALWALASAFL